MDRATLKRRAGERAVEAVDDGDVVGLGSGSTAAAAIRALGERVDAGLDVRGVPTSHQSRQVALEVGVPVVDLDQVDGVDVAVDGADQVAFAGEAASGAETDTSGVAGAGPDDADDASTDERWSDEDGATAEPVGTALIKGGGGAHAREKFVDAAADEFLVVVDPTKLADALDDPVPLAVFPAAHTVVADRVRDLGGEPTLRAAEAKSGPAVTDDGNLLLDCDFGRIDDPGALAAELSAIPGVVEHGLFVDLADAVYVGREDGVERREA